MKKVILMIFSIIICFSFASCKKNEPDIIPSALDPEDVINVYLDVSLYEDLLCEKFEYSISERQKKSGFLTIEKAQENKAVYTIKYKDFNSFKNELLSSRKDIFEDYNQNSEENYIVKIEYDSFITQMTVYVDKNIYNPETNSVYSQYLKAHNCITGCGRNATIYHMYSLGETEKCTVTVKDFSSGEVIETLTYPDILKENKNDS